MLDHGATDRGSYSSDVGQLGTQALPAAPPVPCSQQAESGEGRAGIPSSASPPPACARAGGRGCSGEPQGQLWGGERQVGLRQGPAGQPQAGNVAWWLGAVQLWAPLCMRDSGWGQR